MLIELRMETFRSNKWPFLWLWVGKGSQASPRGGFVVTWWSRFQATQRSPGTVWVDGKCLG